MNNADIFWGKPDQREREYIVCGSPRVCVCARMRSELSVQGKKSEKRSKKTDEVGHTDGAMSVKYARRDLGRDFEGSDIWRRSDGGLRSRNEFLVAWLYRDGVLCLDLGRR